MINGDGIRCLWKALLIQHWYPITNASLEITELMVGTLFVWLSYSALLFL